LFNTIGMNIRNKSYLLIITAFILGAGLGFLLFDYRYSPTSVKEQRAGGYKLINPLYDIETEEGAKEFSSLEKKIVDYTNDSISEDQVDRVSLYFKDLNNGPWFGINEKANFSPASLLKVPVMISYFKKAEKDPSILEKKVKLETNIYQDVAPITKPTNPIEIGKEYRIEDLIEKMIIESDNNALGLLKDNIRQEDIDKVSRDLEVPTSRSLNDFMSVKDYSSFFRVLYNDSYLDTKYSEKALSILTRTEFKEGIKKSLPSNIVVANKFGERHIEGEAKYQLHNCGLVYYPNRPYLLCIMSEGKNYSLLEKIIQDISKIVYEDYNRIAQ